MSAVLTIHDPERRHDDHSSVFDVIEGGGSVQGLMTIPEAFWELSIGIYLIVKGYRTSAIAGLESPVAATTV